MPEADIQRELGEISSTLKSIEKKLDSHGERMNNHSHRLRKIEHRQHWYAGATAVITSIAIYAYNSIKKGSK